jgi:para-nitrobenzyl esterase
MTWKIRCRTTLATCLCAVLLACGGEGSSPDDPLVRTLDAGKVQGASDSGTGTESWKGVPYAQAPVGPLRWRAPLAPQAWGTTLDATRFGEPCIQNGRIYGPGLNNTYDDTIATTLNTPVGSEDCLTLNVWRPAGRAANLPVIVFVYGGSNISGYTADPVYDGARLARAADAVVVTVNYRLGPLGFFNMAQLRTGDPLEDSGNFALLDLIEALRFIQRNVAAFGGDAGRVTLMGQSAGAINTWALLASPAAAGLFHRAVPLSGGISLATNLPAGTLPLLNPAGVYAGQSQSLLVRLLVADGLAADTDAALAYIAGASAEHIAGYLRDKPASELLSVLLASGLTGSGPIPDGHLLPLDPIAAITAGQYNRVPVLAGMTTQEAKLFGPLLPLLGGPTGYRIDDAMRFAVMAGYDPDAAPALTEADILDAAYVPSDTPVTGWTARTDLLAALSFTVNRNSALNALAAQQNEIWTYEFNWAQQPAPWNTVYGAAHAFDLPFLFGNFGPSLFARVTNSQANEPGRLALSSAMMASLGAFARDGNPNHTALGVSWPRWPSRLVFDATASEAAITVP